MTLSLYIFSEKVTWVSLHFGMPDKWVSEDGSVNLFEWMCGNGILQKKKQKKQQQKKQQKTAVLECSVTKIRTN